MYQSSKDMKSLSFCSIYKQSFNIISSNQKLFLQISIFITLPFFIISLISTPLSSFLFPDIYQLTSSSTIPPPPSLSPWTIATFLAFTLAYTILTTALSLLHFSSVTYSVACIYTEHTDVTFKATLSAFKKAWKKLLLTVLAEWVVIFGYTLLAGLIIRATFFTISLELDIAHQAIGSLAMIIIVFVLTGGIVYLCIIWIFGKTVANLETVYGFKALSKSKSLIKGKVFWIIRVLFPMSCMSGLVAWVFLKVVVNGGVIGLGFVIRIGCGVACLVLMVVLSVFAVVVLTLSYLVCKEDRGEGIVKSDVMDHLEIFVDGYCSTPLLKAKDEQINLMA